MSKSLISLILCFGCLQVSGCGSSASAAADSAGATDVGSADLPQPLDADALSVDASSTAGDLPVAAEDAPGDDLPSDDGPQDTAATDGPGVDADAASLWPVFINEVAAQGTSSGTFNPSGGDWAELYNSGLTPVDLTEWRIASKTKAFADAHVLGPAAQLPGHGYLILYFNTVGQGVPNINDKIKGSADSSLQLWSPQQQIVDGVAWTVADVVKGGSYGRSPDGGDSWHVYAKGQATPGQPNF